MSAVAMRSFSTETSATAPATSAWSLTRAGRKRCSRAIVSPELPFGISSLATSTVRGAVLAVPSLRAEWIAAKTRIAASPAAIVATTSAPLRVPRRARSEVVLLCSISGSPLARQDAEAGRDCVLVAGIRRGCPALRLDVRDEVADDVALATRVVVGAAVGLGARVAEARALALPACDVERREAGDGDGRVAGPAERSERRQQQLDDPRIGRIPVAEVLDVEVGTRAAGRLVGAQDAVVEPGRDLVRRGAVGHRDAVPRLRAGPQGRLAAGAGGSVVRRVLRAAALGDLVLEVGDGGVTVDRARLV